MPRGSLGALLLGVTVSALALEPGSPEDVLRRYLQAIKTEKFDAAYDLVSKAMRQGKGKEEFVKESQATMGYADVKIFDFTVYPGKVEGEKALVPNILESQDRFVNTLGLTEYELYTLVREDGRWKVDSQILVEPAEQPKWFPKKKDTSGEKAGEQSGAKAAEQGPGKPKDTVPH
jgi:NTF2-like N-terminal transpeptidase domain